MFDCDADQNPGSAFSEELYYRCAPEVVDYEGLPVRNLANANSNQAFVLIAVCSS